MNINSEFTKYVLLALTFQWWFPFLKAIWDDFNDALRDEGGLFGMAPPRKRLEEMDLELGEYESSLRSELHGTFGSGGGSFGGQGAPGPAPGPAPGGQQPASPPSRKSGFR